MRFLLLLVMLVISVSGLADDMDEFERMMQEPKDRASWVDPMDMGMLNCEAVERKLRECDGDLGECRIQLDKISTGINANKSKEQPMLLDFCQCLSVLVFVFHFQFNLYLTEPFFQVLYCLQSGKSNESLQEK